MPSTYKLLRWRAYRDTKDDSLRDCGRDKSRRIDLGLELCALHARPGECLTTHDIAAWCGCTNECIAQIERRALRKLCVKLGLIKALDRGNLRDHISPG